MRVGTVISLPDSYSRYGRILGQDGMGYTVESGQIPKDTEVGDDCAYQVELWENDSGLAYNLKER